jgi:hypothetical protein
MEQVNKRAEVESIRLSRRCIDDMPGSRYTGKGKEKPTMVTANDLLALRTARPFVPFRFILRDGGSVEARSPEVIAIGRRFAIIGLLDPGTTDTFFDRWVVVWYMHVTRVEALSAGPPPFTAGPGPAESPSSTPA